MKEGIGSTFTYNIIAIFIVVAFAILAGTMSYFKAFKVNSRIVGIIEKYEGYNDLAISEIQRTLSTIGYRWIDGLKCPTKENAKLYEPNKSFTYCVYLYCDEDDPYEYRYGVTTYITIDFPVIRKLVKLPVYTETNSLHGMGNSKCRID